MITLRKFFIGLLALTTLGVAAYVVYELTPERRARRVAVRLKRLYDDILEHPEMDIREEYYSKRVDELSKELYEVGCRCEPPHTGSGPHSPYRWRYSGVHKEGCLYSELFKEVKEKAKKERARRVREGLRR